MTGKSELGKLGENLACRYLEEKGYKIIGRNIKKSWGELDIVAQYFDKTLVFVEVKTMIAGQDLKPEDQMSWSKISKTKKMAEAYANHNPKLVHDIKGWRIDLVTVEIKEGCRSFSSRGQKCFDIKHYENIE